MHVADGVASDPPRTLIITVSVHATLHVHSVHKTLKTAATEMRESHFDENNCNIVFLFSAL